MPGAVIRIDQAAHSSPTGPVGQSRDDIWKDQVVTLVSAAETPPNTSWQWTLLDRPPGSASTLLGATRSSATFTPDVVGSYRIRLEAGGTSQIRIVGVLRDGAGAIIRRGWRIPALDEATSGLDESNFGGQLRGWDATIRHVLSDIDDALTRTARVVTVGPSSSNATHLTDGANDEVQINAAIAEMSAADGGKVVLLPGEYTIGAPINLLPNVVLSGSGAKATMIVVTAAFLNTHAWAIGCAGKLAPETEILLVKDALQGATTLVEKDDRDISALTALDDLMLVSEAPWETTNLSGRKRGEFVRVATRSSSNLTLYGMVRDFYTQADTARLYRVSFVEGCGVEDLSIRRQPRLDGPVDEIVPPLMSLQMSRNAFIRNCELSDNDGSGITVFHSVQAVIASNYIHDLSDDTAKKHYGYGVLIGGASEGVVVYGNRFSRTRHAVDSGPSRALPGAFEAVKLHGVARAVAVIGNTSLHSTNAPYSTHSEAEGWVFQGNVAENSWSCGFFMRGRSMSIVGNVVQWCSGGIQIGNQTINESSGSASGSHVVGNTIRHIKSLPPAPNRTNFAGYGIILALTDNVTVRGNTISATDAAGIRLRPYARRCAIIGNVITNANLLNTANMPAVELESNPSGSAASLTLSGTTVTATGLSGLTSACVGKTIVISGSLGNNGAFTLTWFKSDPSDPSKSTVTWENASGATENTSTLSWYIESATDNLFSDNVAMNTPASDYDRDVTGHAKYMFRDGSSRGNARNTFTGNKAMGMESDFMSLMAVHHASNNVRDGGIVQHGSEKQSRREYPIVRTTSGISPVVLLSVPTVSGRTYVVKGLIQGTTGSAGRWYYAIDAFFDHTAGVLTQRLAAPVTQVHESSSSVLLEVLAVEKSIEVRITPVAGQVTWVGNIDISEARA
jgi:hypothetical protein